MIPDPLAIVEAYLAAQARHDFVAMRGLLADQGFRFRSPIADFDRAEDFVEYAAMSSGIIIDKEVRKVFVAGADVCHILTYRIQISEKQSVEVAQWSQAQAGRIQRIETIFDASAYRALFPGEESAG